MARTISLAPGEFYHLYNRGTEKRDIFMDADDYSRFLALLYLANRQESADLKLQGSTLLEIEPEEGPSLVSLAVYCLMPNHFHFLVREHNEGGISKFMQKLSTGYTMYFNKKHERSGSLFQGRFKATHVGNDRYLRYLISYIHLNPIKLIEPQWKETGISDRRRAETYLGEYPYSSYRDYLGESRVHKMLLEPGVLPEYFESSTEFKTQVTEWLSYRPE